MERNLFVLGSARRHSILDALPRTRGVAGLLSIITQTTSSIYQSSHVRRLQWESSRHTMHDYHPLDIHRPFGAHLQCLDVHGFWIVLCLLVDLDSFGICVSLGPHLSQIGLWHSGRSPRAPQNLQVQLWTFVHVV